MSVPISACLLAKAAFDAPGARKRLLERASDNRRFGAFSFWPCPHRPRCPMPTDEQLYALALEVPEIGELIVKLAGPDDEAEIVKGGLS